MTEIVLDVPNAYHILSKFVERCFAAGFVSRVIMEQIPQRSVEDKGWTSTEVCVCVHVRMHAWQNILPVLRAPICTHTCSLTCFLYMFVVGAESAM